MSNRHDKSICNPGFIQLARVPGCLVGGRCRVLWGLQRQQAKMKILDIPRSGSYAGFTSSHNRAGQYVRNRRSPVQPIGLGRRATVRNNLAAASAAWAALTDAQRAAWVSYANDHPYVDALGQSIKLTGHQMYVAIGANLLNDGSALNSAPPVDSTVLVINPATASYSVATGLSCTFTTGDGSGWVNISCSQPMSAGRMFNRTFRQLLVQADDTSPATVSSSIYTTNFGTVVIGQRIFVSMRPVNQYGVAGSPVIVSTLAAA
jgi:hypothetical protein